MGTTTPTDRQREAVALRDSGKSLSEIAAALGIKSTGAAGDLVRKGLTAMGRGDEIGAGNGGGVKAAPVAPIDEFRSQLAAARDDLTKVEAADVDPDDDKAVADVIAGTARERVERLRDQLDRAATALDEAAALVAAVESGEVTDDQKKAIDAARPKVKADRDAAAARRTALQQRVDQLEAAVAAIESLGS